MIKHVISIVVIEYYILYSIGIAYTMHTTTSDIRCIASMSEHEAPWLCGA